MGDRFERDPPSHVRPLRQGIAFGLSLAAHLAILVLGGLLLRPLGRQALTEGDRPAAIVLATADRSGHVEYFAETSATASDHATSAAPAQPVASSSGLPSLEPPSPSSAAITLPSASTPLLPGMTSASQLGEAIGRNAPRIGADQSIAEILAEEAKRPKSAGPVGPPGQVSLFGGGATRGHSFVFLIDRSQSMGSEGLGAIDAAKKELAAALNKLESNHKFQVVAYNQSPTYMHERRLLPVAGESRAWCEEFLDTLVAFGATDHERALVSALQLKPDVIYLLTDGDPALSAPQRKRIHDESHGRVTISCIQFGRIQPDDEATRRSLEALARENGGTYTFVDMGKR